ncbi:hypothetical protein [Bacillus sp. FJAT-26390]|uniref:tubby C-terminal domain-like protein n=1 Tax=Bacillus sp. FJAT-26390 TaxID=1743142 RepID=UPI000807D666|nr:hypothetical protein [Bacillus sp. FJAT-26390]OBZ11283.1 hypothetical protein A7975_20265 [Bacillus sp. FJAT-26390]
MIYKAIIPLLRMSTSPVLINDEIGQAVGTMNRYHSSKIQRLMNTLFDNVVNNVQAFNLEGEVQADIKEINTIKTLLMEKWHVRLREQHFICENRTKIRTHPQFYYEKGTVKVWIKKDFTDRTIRFTVDQVVVAEVYPEGLLPPKSNHLTFKIWDARFDIYEIASLYYVFNLKN